MMSKTRQIQIQNARNLRNTYVTDLGEAPLDGGVEEVVERVFEEEVEEGVEGAALDQARVHRLVVRRQQGRHQPRDA